MVTRQKRIWPYIAAALGLGTAGILMLIVAISTASLRFGYCGASTLTAGEQYCRAGMQMLYASYVVLSAALVLATIALWLRSKSQKPESGDLP